MKHSETIAKRINTNLITNGISRQRRKNKQLESQHQNQVNHTLKHTTQGSQFTIQKSKQTKTKLMRQTMCYLT